MIYHLFLSRAAVHDIEHAMLWYENQRKGLGFEFELCLEESLKLLEQDPFLFQRKYEAVRVTYIKRFPYGIHYIIESFSIKVIAVFHMVHNPIRWNDRLNRDELS